MQSQSIIRRHLDEAQARLAVIEDERTELITEIDALQEALSKLPPEKNPTDNRSKESIEPNEPRYGSKRDRYERAIEGIVVELGPQHRIQLLAHMRQEGVIGDERDPLANISNILSTSKKFKSMGSGIWGLVALM